MNQYLKRTAAATAVAAAFAIAGCGGGSDESAATVMPGVEGLSLDVALSDIERAGIEDEVEVLGGGTFGVVVESNWEVCEQVPAAGETVTEAPRLTVERSCPDAATEPAVTQPTEPEVTEPRVTEPEVTEPEVTESEPADTNPAPPPTDPETDASTEQPSDEVAEQDPYVYEGPQYEIVSRDVLGIGLDQFWVLIDKLDYSTDAYEDQVKLIISDIARDQGTAAISVNVVTDIEIALLESSSTVEDFYAEFGDDYVNNVVLPKEATDWIASYTGGFDFGTNEMSDSENAYEVIWFIGGDDPDLENWKPE